MLSHRAEFLPGAIASVLAQTVPAERRQLLVNHCTEAYHNKFNDVAAAARGEFLVPLCDDDLLDPNFLERCLSVADRAGGADIIVTDRRVRFDMAVNEITAARESIPLDAGDVWREFGEEYPPLPDLADGTPGYYRIQLNPQVFTAGATLPMTCMIRKRFWDVMQGYDDTVAHMDTEFWSRAAQVGAMVHYVPGAAWEYRKHGDVDVMPFLRSWNRKHFRRFGQAWEHAVELSPRNWFVPTIPEEEREAYIAQYYPELVESAPMTASTR